MKLFLLTDDMVVYIEIVMESVIKKLLEPINEFAGLQDTR